MDGGLVREVIECDVSPADGAITVPHSIEPIPGKWRYSDERGFFPDAQLLQVDMTAAIQNRLDDYCVARGYDGILSAVSYAGSSHPVFGPQGIAARTWRDACWSMGIEVMGQVEAGTLACPSEDALVAMLPEPGW